MRFKLAPYSALAFAGLLAPISSAPGGFASPPPIAKVLEQWAAAVGGRKQIRPVTIRSDAMTERIGGSTERERTSRGYRELVRQAEGTEETVCDRSSCWLRDWNGTVQKLQGHDLEDARTAALDVTVRLESLDDW